MPLLPLKDAIHSHADSLQHGDFPLCFAHDSVNARQLLTRCLHPVLLASLQASPGMGLERVSVCAAAAESHSNVCHRGSWVLQVTSTHQLRCHGRQLLLQRMIVFVQLDQLRLLAFPVSLAAVAGVGCLNIHASRTATSVHKGAGLLARSRVGHAGP